MALRKEKLETYKTQLLDRQQTLVRELHQQTTELIEDEPFFADSVDQASADSEKSLALQIKNRDRQVLAQINEALRRIEEGSFGECEECGEDIAEARIKANLGTTLCIDCKAELENEQNRFQGRA